MFSQLFVLSIIDNFPPPIQWVGFSIESNQVATKYLLILIMMFVNMHIQ